MTRLRIHLRSLGLSRLGCPVALAIACSGSGCTTIKIVSDRGDVSVHRGFGIVVIQPAPDAKAGYQAEIKGIGLLKTPFTWNLGYQDTRIAVNPPANSTIIFTPHNPPTVQSPLL